MARKTLLVFLGISLLFKLLSTRFSIFKPSPTLKSSLFHMSKIKIGTLSADEKF